MGQRNVNDFEKRLKDALDLPVDPALVESLLPPAEAATTSSSPWRGWAIAAGVVTMIGAGVLAWQLAGPPPAVEDYVRDHYRHDGAAVLARSGNTAATAADIAAVLGAFDLDAAPTLAGQVAFIKFCPTPHGRGAHMVLRTVDGPVTVIVMPDTPLEGATRLAFDDVVVELLTLPSGSAAVIGPNADADTRVARLVREGLVPSGTGA